MATGGEDADLSAEVPELRGLDVDVARAVGEDSGLVVTSHDPDGAPLGVLTWPGRWVVVEQTPHPGARVRRGDVVAIRFEKRPDGGEAGVREPRRPLPGSGALAAEREPGVPDDG